MTAGGEAMTRATTPRTSLYVTPAERRALRELAAALGLTVSRGPGAGELGSVAALASRLAAAYARDPAGTRERVAALLGPTPGS
jgi:hypothetical protein